MPTEYGHGDAEDDECDADGDGPARVPQARRRHALVGTTAEEAVATAGAAVARGRRTRRGALRGPQFSRTYFGSSFGLKPERLG